MSRQALADSLKAVPILEHLGITVEEAKAGSVKLRLPCLLFNQNGAGQVSHGALFQLAEAAAAIALGTHDELRQYEHKHKVSHIQYRAWSSRDVTARAKVTKELVETVRSLIEATGEATMELPVSVMDGYGKDICLVTPVFSFKERQ